MKPGTLLARLRAAVDVLGGSVDAAIAEAREQGRIDAALEVDRLQAEIVAKARPGEERAFGAAYRALSDAVKAIENGLSEEGRRRLTAARLAVAAIRVTVAPPRVGLIPS